MHMSDALVSPGVAGAMWAATAGVAGLSARALRKDPDDRRVPLMGVLGAFVFAAQMVNFAIPGTGSSGHLGGGLLLAILVGPSASFLVMASVLVVQALFFGDGGLLALGCNILNLGFFASFVAYPLVFRPLAGARPSRARLAAAAVAAGVVALQLGSLGVVAETVLSGRTELSLPSFLLLMQPIHLAIGVVEGFVTAAVVLLVRESRPDLVPAPAVPGARARRAIGRFAAAGLLAALLVGGLVSQFSSEKPDGLEWSLARALGQAETAPPATGVHGFVAQIQARTRLFREDEIARSPATGGPESRSEPWSAVPRGVSLPGLVGAALTLALAGLTGAGLRALRRGPRSAISR